MRRSLLEILLVFIMSSSLHAQLLSLDQTTEYLTQYLTEELSTEDITKGLKSIEFQTVGTDHLNIKYHLSGSDEFLMPEYWDGDIDYNEFEIDINEIKGIEQSTYQAQPVILLRCKNGTKNCVKVKQEAISWHYGTGFVDRPGANNYYDYIHLLYLPNQKTQSTIYGGLLYLFNEMTKATSISDHMNPFSEKNISFNTNHKEVVNLNNSGGVSTLAVDISGKLVEVILDSGASSVSISKTLESVLLKSGRIDYNDYQSPGLFRIADGSTVTSDRFILPYININGVKVENVQCSVNQSEDIILLGKSFLDRFKSWTIDNDLNQLILEY